MRAWLLSWASYLDDRQHRHLYPRRIKWLCDLAELSYGCPYGDPRTDAINWPHGCSRCARVLYRILGGNNG